MPHPPEEQELRLVYDATVCYTTDPWEDGGQG